ncbi:hypothetical protein MKW98_023504, partial [Papaver atlanticum]
ISSPNQLNLVKVLKISTLVILVSSSFRLGQISFLAFPYVPKVIANSYEGLLRMVSGMRNVITDTIQESSRYQHDAALRSDEVNYYRRSEFWNFERWGIFMCHLCRVVEEVQMKLEDRPQIAISNNSIASSISLLQPDFILHVPPKEAKSLPDELQNKLKELQILGDVVIKWQSSFQQCATNWDLSIF